MTVIYNIIDFFESEKRKKNEDKLCMYVNALNVTNLEIWKIFKCSLQKKKKLVKREK